jgi:hypothetical protein
MFLVFKCRHDLFLEPKQLIAEFETEEEARQFASDMEQASLDIFTWFDFIEE